MQVQYAGQSLFEKLPRGWKQNINFSSESLGQPAGRFGLPLSSFRSYTCTRARTHTVRALKSLITRCCLPETAAPFAHSVTNRGTEKKSTSSCYIPYSSGSRGTRTFRTVKAQIDFANICNTYTKPASY